ncbi:MAG TPA: glycine oxidase ThiO [Rhizomicrobium sp.]|nr:glycine oxidase ThiO [Rhizomicrobium sp.]
MRIVIIGAGVAGLSIGWRLAQAGAEVTVLERAQPGHAATWASAGMISATAEIGDHHTPEARFARHSAALWPHFAREIEEISGIDIGFRVDGTLIVARTPDQAATLRARAKGSAGLEFLATANARALEPLLPAEMVGALFDPNEAQVDNRALGSAVAIAFQRAGGVLHTNEAVVRIETGNGRAVAARTPFSRYDADVFILAAGAWSSRLEGLPPAAVPQVIPVKGEMIALAPSGATLPRHMIWGNEVYLVPRRDRLLVGATVSCEGFDSRTTEAAATWLQEHVVGLMPALHAWPVVEHWAGLRPGSPDDLPLIGETALDGLFVASGQYRNGILLAPAIADAMRDLLLGKEIAAEIRAFDPSRFVADRSPSID